MPLSRIPATWYATSMPTIAIIGASANRRKFGNKAVRAYAARGYQVFPVNPHEKTIEGQNVYASIQDVPVAELDLVSFYVPPEIGIQLLPAIARKPPQEIFLNPGSESEALIAEARRLGLNVVQGCSILAVGVNPHDLP
jgi:predicted CoA-binding protein